MSVEDLTKIKERIAKLLRMAEDSSSPNEAAIAASRARKLMDKYQLDALDLGDEIAEQFGKEQATRYFAAIPGYMNWFATAVAKYNDCQPRFELGVVTFKKKNPREQRVGNAIFFQGYASDVQLAVQMYHALNEAVNKLCKEYLRDLGFSNYPVRIGGAFKTGAFLEISRRLDEMTVERDAITCSTGTSLVVMKTAAVSEFFGEVKYKQMKMKSAEDDIELDAKVRGRAAGSKIEIIKSVE